MGQKYEVWHSRSSCSPETDFQVGELIKTSRSFEEIEKLEYGDHGLEMARNAIKKAIQSKQRIALYADYDVDGTMSCVSWVWFFNAIGFSNFIHYIPCRFKEGYGLNLDAVKYLVEDEKADLIITMDTGITANEEAAWCREQGVTFICTDHHKIQPDKMPDCIILNPKMHPDPIYQELCGCGITFVLLRQLGNDFPISMKDWTDILALVGMATICDVVPLNGVNHKLARSGVQALLKSERNVLRSLRESCSVKYNLDEKDVGFRVGPRINAVGRLDHADAVVKAFTQNDPDELVAFMDQCNEERKLIQSRIYSEAILDAEKYADDPILFLGGDWHPGVVGIAATKLVERFWKPVWLFCRKDDVCKGSARSIPGFDVTDAMSAAANMFTKFGGHAAAGGYSFDKSNEDSIRNCIIKFAHNHRQQFPQKWISQTTFDLTLPGDLVSMSLADTLDSMKPFGHGFEEPVFKIEGDVINVIYFKDKVTGEPKHTKLTIASTAGLKQTIMFFNEVYDSLESCDRIETLVTAGKNRWQGRTTLSLIGVDWRNLSDQD